MLLADGGGGDGKVVPTLLTKTHFAVPLAAFRGRLRMRRTCPRPLVFALLMETASAVCQAAMWRQVCREAAARWIGL